MENRKFTPLLNSLFVHIPKTAGMTIYDTILNLKRNFGWFLGSDLDDKQDKSIRKIENNGSYTLCHIYYKSLIEKGYLDKKYFNNSFKFCFVRNPYDRLVSLYEYHRIKDRLKLDFDTFVELLYKEYIYKRIPPIGLYNIKTFPKDSKLYHKDIYGNQYNSMIKWIPSNIGFIGRFEDFDSEIDKLLRILGYTGPIINVKKTNYSKHDNYIKYYNNRTTIKYVSKMYKKDIIRFGYKFL
jgi:hypothetical protein